MSLVYLGKATPEGGGSSPVIESLSITPTTSQQTITATTGTDGYSPITVAAVTAAIDANIVSANIVSGINILGVDGVATVLNGDTLSVTPSTSAQTLTPTSPKNGFTQVDVSAVTSSIDANIVAGNIKKDVTILDVVGTYEGSTPSGKYQLFDRVKDDNNVEIGTVSGFFTDANDTEYAVVCLDAQYRLASGQWLSANAEVTNLPLLNASTWGGWETTDTATFNTQKILDFCTSNSYTSTACSHCRSKSFTIEGVTYYGQLPNVVELNDIVRNHTAINTADTTANNYTTVNFASSRMAWSSSQMFATDGWGVHENGTFYGITKSNSYVVVPVLEIPNQ